MIDVPGIQWCSVESHWRRVHTWAYRPVPLWCAARTLHLPARCTSPFDPIIIGTSLFAFLYSKFSSSVFLIGEMTKNVLNKYIIKKNNNYFYEQGPWKQCCTNFLKAKCTNDIKNPIEGLWKYLESMSNTVLKAIFGQIIF